ncbi:MAG: polysaccharide biosynthesis tyrosine autokinase, partial [Thermodesulfobacteriota bacterium]
YNGSEIQNKQSGQLSTPDIHIDYDSYTEEEGSSLFEYTDVIFRRKRIVLASVLATIIIVTIASLLMDKIYKADATIEIVPDAPKVTGFREVTDNQQGQDEFYETQYKLIKSRSLARNVINTLDLGSHPDFAPKDEEEKNIEITDAAEADVNKELNSNIFEKQERLVNAFLDSVSVEPDRQSRLVIISFESKDKNLSALAVNTLADEYIEWNLEKKLDVSKSAGESLRTQLEGVRKKLAVTQDELSEYAKKFDIVSLDKNLNLTYKQLGELNDAFAKAQTARLSQEALYEELKSGNEEVLPEIIGDPAVRQLKLEYIKVKSQYDTLDATFGPNYPEMKQVGAQLSRIKSEMDNQLSDIKRSIEKGYKSAKKKEEILWASAKEQKQRAAELNEAAIQFNALKQEVDTNKSIYANLLQRLKETEVTSGIRATNVKVIDYAFPPLRHFKPNIIINILIAAWLGLMGGVLLAFVFEHFDRTIRDEEEIKKRFPLPFMGKIPFAEKYELEGLEKVAYTKPLSKISEAFRVLKTSILYSSPDHKPPKALLVTSTQPKEGKTTISTNLALSLVQSGLRVVLVDADLRNPSLHNLFLENGNNPHGSEFGLSTYLDGKTDYKSIINPTNYGGLDLIPAGRVLPNPADLIDSKRMKDLIKQLVKDYDNVILDGLPIMELADTRLLSRQVDSVLLVASVGIAQRHELKNSIEELVKIGARIIGVVVNRLEMPKKSGEEYYYFYNSEENKPYIEKDDNTFGVSGRIEDTSFAELLSKFHHEKSYGQLHIESDIHLNIYFNDGYIQFVEYDDPNLRIGKLLVETETISVEDQESAINYSLKSDLKFGEALIKLEKISPHELSDILELQLKLKLLNGFRNREGFYGFKYSSQIEVNSIFRIDPIEVIYDAVNHLYVIDDQTSTDSYLDGVIHPKEGLQTKLSELKLTSINQIKLANMIEDNCTISSIVGNSPLKPDETFKFLKFLELAELISVEHSINQQPNDLLIDPLDDNTFLVNENVIEERINDEIKKL